MASTLSAYNTRDSPFLDLDSPFTVWYACLLGEIENSISLPGINVRNRLIKKTLAPLTIDPNPSLFPLSISRPPKTNREALKLLLLSPLIIPRCLGALAACTLLAAMSALAAWDWPESRPLSRPRRALTVAASKLAGVVLWSLGFSVRVRGREHLRRALRAKEDRPILIFNHVSEKKKGELVFFFYARSLLFAFSTSTSTKKKLPLNAVSLSPSLFFSLHQVSWADAPLVMYLAAASGVSRASNKDIPLIGTCIRAFQNIYVERAGERKEETAEKEGGTGARVGAGSETAPPSSSSSSSSSSGGVTAAIQARVRGDPAWPNLILAPEGTCGDGKCLLRFRTGAFVPGAPILPILFKYENRFFNPAWGIVADERIHFVRALCQFRKRVDVLVLPPYLPSDEEKRDAALFAGNVRRLCAEALGVPTRDDQGYEEFAALLRAGVSVSADGRRVVAPAGVVDAGTGLVDLTGPAARGARRRAGEEKKDE